MFTLSLKPSVWKCHVVIWQTTSEHCVKVRAARCSTIIFAHSTNQIIVFWRCCCRWLRLCLSSLLKSWRLHQSLFLPPKWRTKRGPALEMSAFFTVLWRWQFDFHQHAWRDVSCLSHFPRGRVNVKWYIHFSYRKEPGLMRAGYNFDQRQYQQQPKG